MCVVCRRYTDIIKSYKEIEIVENTVNLEMSKIHKWLCTNRLSINLSKTNYMVFNKLSIYIDINTKRVIFRSI